MKINCLSCGHKHVVLLYSPACLVRKTRSDRLHRNPIFVLFRTLARRMSLLIVRRVTRLARATPWQARPPTGRRSDGEHSG